ncbi:MAG TPA: HK97 family phage prohead protease, partial [Vicinamibacterales bacterium]|nr:HK97 family phage prohead protease [Vicinamibacterales bacterium]
MATIKKPTATGRGATPTEDPKTVDQRLERRTFAGTVTLRDADKKPQLQGYAAVFNQETVIGSWFREVIAPGAFADAIVNDDVRGLFNHNENKVLGRNKSGTLQLSEDETGLKYVIDPPDTQDGRDVVTLVQRGDIDGSSFAFTVPDDGDEWNHDEVKLGKLPLRIIKKVSLYDVSPVTYPAYPQTAGLLQTVSARARTMATTPAAAAAPDPKDQKAAPASASTRDDSDANTGGDPAVNSSVAIQKTIKRANQLQKAVRSMVKALDISHGFNPSGGDLTGPGGSKLDTGRSKHQRRKLTRRAAKARRDGGDSAMDSTSAAMYYSARALRSHMRGIQHCMSTIKTMCRDAGIDLSVNAGQRDGDGTDGSVTGSDAGAAG